MRNLFIVIVSLMAGVGAVAGRAMAQPLGGVWDMSAQELKVAYPNSANAPGHNGQVVEMRAVTIMGVRWDRIEFRYDENQRLTRLRLFTTARTYEQMEAEMSNTMDPLWAVGSDEIGQAPARQVMLCDYGSDGVVLSFDQPSVALPKTIVASVDTGETLR